MTLETGAIFELMSFIVALIGGILATFKYFSVELARLRNEADLKDLAITESQSKREAAITNMIQMAVTRMESEQSKLADRMTSLALDTVRKSEMAAIETRITATLQGVETRFMAMLDKVEVTRSAQLAHLEAKIDRMAGQR